MKRTAAALGAMVMLAGVVIPTSGAVAAPSPDVVPTASTASQRGAAGAKTLFIRSNKAMKTAAVKVRHKPDQRVVVMWGDGAGNGQVGCKTRSQKMCTTTFRHTYGNPGEFTIEATANDVVLKTKTITAGTVRTPATPADEAPVAIPLPGDGPAGSPGGPADTPEQTVPVNPQRDETPVSRPTTPAATSRVGMGWQNQMLDAVNAKRTSAGVSPLTMCPALERAAQGFADYMAINNAYGHDADGRQHWDRTEEQGYGHYVATAENIAAGQDDVTEVMNQWIDSPGHYANIMNPTYTHAGFGYAFNADDAPWKTRWVQNFGGRGTC